jgi:hypothetical protein
MCQAIPSCYGVGEVWCHKMITDRIEDFVCENPTATPLKIKNFIEKVCSKNLIGDIIEFYKKDLKYRKRLANNPRKCQTTRLINKRLCERYEKILSAFK